MKRHKTQPRSKASRAKENSTLLEAKLASLQVEPPSDLDQYEKEIWNREIVPLINLGIVKETDYSACIAYCELACLRVSDLPATKLTYLSRLRDQLGLTPAARLKVAPTLAVQSNKETIADVLKLHVV